MSQIYPAQGVHPSGTATIGTTPRSSILVPMDKRLTAKIRGCSMETVPFKVVTLKRFIGGTTHLGNFQIALVRIYCKCLRINTFPFLQHIALATFSRGSLIVLQWFIPLMTMNLEQQRRSHAMMASFSQTGRPTEGHVSNMSVSRKFLENPTRRARQPREVILLFRRTTTSTYLSVA